jgi:outer membrane lipoprotein-sorting protein
VALLAGCVSHRMTGGQVIQRAQAALVETNAFHFVLDVEMDTDLLKDALSIDVWEYPPDRIKLRVLSAVNPQLQGLVFATDGEQSISYSRHANEVTVGPADVIKLPSVIESLIRARREWIQAADAHKTRVVIRERMDGLVVYKVQVPLAQDGYAQYWIDVRHWWVRKVTYQDVFLGKGTIFVRAIEGFEDLPDAHFGIQVPDGATVTEVTMESSRPLTLEEAQMAVGFPLRRPTYLPSGVEFLVAYQLDKNMALVYEGERSFTLVQGPSIGLVPHKDATLVSVFEQQATLVRDEEDGGMLLTWREGDLQFSIAGSLSREELVRIAESLE